MNGEYRAAEELYLYSLMRAPHLFPELGGELGDLYLTMGLPQQALLGYDRNIRYRPRDASAINGRGIARARLREFEAARGDFDRVIALSPDSEAAYYNRALVNETLGNMEGALRDYSRTLEIDPGHGPARERMEQIGPAP